jgi:hypothetical protein
MLFDPGTFGVDLHRDRDAVIGIIDQQDVISREKTTVPVCRTLVRAGNAHAERVTVCPASSVTPLFRLRDGVQHFIEIAVADSSAFEECLRPADK